MRSAHIQSRMQNRRPRPTRRNHDKERNYPVSLRRRCLSNLYLFPFLPDDLFGVIHVTAFRQFILTRQLGVGRYRTVSRLLRSRLRLPSLLCGYEKSQSLPNVNGFRFGPILFVVQLWLIARRTTKPPDRLSSK